MWIASSLAWLDALGSPEKLGNSVIHLCMSVKRTVSGSVSGYLSVSAMAMSSVSSQSKVAGILLLGDSLQVRDRSKLTRLSMVSFLGVILVAVGNFHHDVRSAVRPGFAAQPRFRRDTLRLIELVHLRVGR